MLNISPATNYVLKALVPYTKPNLELSFKPSVFFYELEKKSHTKERTLRSAYYRAIKSGLIEMDGLDVPRLTKKGQKLSKPYKPAMLGKNAYLMVIFDIPEGERTKRSHLRLLLKELSFKQVQQSVWVSKYDHREYLAAEIEEYELEDFVQVFEAAELLV